jgi:hypothetical protein
VSRLGYNAHYPLGELEPLGKKAVIPLLTLAARWASSPEWTTDNDDDCEETPMHEVLLYLLWKVKDLKHKDRQAELLLCEFLAKSCRINEGREVWGILPVHCAKCLHEIFVGYPEPKMEGNNALGNRVEFLLIARQKLKSK